MRSVIENANVFDGDALLGRKSVVIEDGRIVDVTDPKDAPRTAVRTELDKDWTLVPGFIDLQVNGGGGALFNADPRVDTIRRIGSAHRTFGTTGFLPTLITDDLEVMREAAAAVDLAIAEGVPGVLGIHLEGPFLNAAKRGIHDANKIREVDEAGFNVVTSLRRGKTLVTLAPEQTGLDVVRRLCNAGVVVAAGHSMADYAETQAALEAGITGFTHLYNAMTPLTSREPGMVGAALEDKKSWFGIIADGHHVHPASVFAAVNSKQRGGAILVTDAMPSVGATSKCFMLGDETIAYLDGALKNAEGTLAGSDLDMLSAVDNVAAYARIDWFEAVRMASRYPAAALGIDSEFGSIRPGYVANIVAVDRHRRIAGVWIDGKRHVNTEAA